MQIWRELVGSQREPMSKLAQAVEQAVYELRSKRKRTRTEVRVDDEREIEKLDEAITEGTTETEQVKGATMTKAKATKAKSEKKPRVKKEKAAKAEKVALGGPITGVKASGETYVQVQFGDQHMTLSPTSNRTKNRDLFVSALRALLS